MKVCFHFIAVFVFSTLSGPAMGSTLDPTNTAPLLAPTNPTPSVTLAWSASPSTGVVSYAVYYGTSSGAYTTKLVQSALATNNTMRITGLLYGHSYYFSATAIDVNHLESPLSNEVVYQVPSLPLAPTMGAVVKLAVDEKAKLEDPWSDSGLPGFALSPDRQSDFFRLRIVSTQ